MCIRDSMGTLLPACDRARALLLNRLLGLPQTAIGLDREERDDSGSIVRDK